MKLSFAIIIALFLTQYSFSQPLNPVRWSFDTEVVNKNEFNLVFTAAIDDGWHMYGLNMPDGGPYPVSFNYDDTAGFEISDRPIAVIKPVEKFDEVLGMKLETLDKKGLFKHRIKLLTQKEINISGFDKQQVGQVAAEIKSLRLPDVYKGKGIRYAGEVLRKKVGKTGA